MGRYIASSHSFGVHRKNLIIDIWSILVSHTFRLPARLEGCLIEGPLASPIHPEHLPDDNAQLDC